MINKMGCSKLRSADRGHTSRDSIRVTPVELWVRHMIELPIIGNLTDPFLLVPAAFVGLARRRWIRCALAAASRDRDQRFHYVRLQLGRVDVTGGRVGLDNLRISHALACGMGVE
jgi:hypothetical protein